MPLDASRERGRALLFAASLANLAMLHVWSVLLYPARADRYYLPDYGAYHYAAALLLLLALTALVFAVSELVHRAGRPVFTGLAYAACLTALLAPLDLTREALGLTRFELLHLGRSLPLPLRAGIAVAVVAAAGFALRHWRRVVRGVGLAVVVMSPLALGNVAQAVWHGVHAESRTGDAGELARPAGGMARANAARAVWIVFDELDYRLAFPDRPATVSLPELDRLRAESFFARAAGEASDHTGTAIPALLLGRPVTWASPEGPSELSLKLDGGDAATVPLAGLDTFLDAAAARDLRTGVVGIYHPYCRLFGDALARCHWDPFLPGGGLHAAEGFPEVLASLAYKLVPLLHYRGEHIASIQRTARAAGEMAADASLDVVFAHLPVPHSPYVWDQARGRFTVFQFDDDAYFEQLALADRVLGQLRREMEQSGTWGRSVVLVTSDHGWRFAETHGSDRDHRVPFLLKLPGERAGIEYERAFPAWRARELLLAALDGGVRSADDVALWLDGRDGATVADRLTPPRVDRVE